ncbi:hypothetical protein ACRAWF_43515 [Streptomyces sp. L7]
MPLAQRQTQPSTFGGTTTGSRRDWLKSGSTSAPADGARGTRSHVVDVDAHLLVEGPAGTRHVTGTVTLRVEERDLLGHGLLTPAETRRTSTTCSALVPDWATAQPHTPARTPARRDPRRQPRRPVLGGPRRGSAGRASRPGLYGASRTAVLGNRPLELMTRDQQGIRRWGFTPEGALVTDDRTSPPPGPPSTPRPNSCTPPPDTLDDTPQLLNRLTVALQLANRAHTTAVEDHQEAQHAVTDAIDVRRRSDAEGRRFRPGRA